MNLRTVIADETGQYLKTLQAMLQEHPDLQVQWVYADFDKAIDELPKLPWDILFLYIPKPTLDCKGSHITSLIAPYTVLITDSTEFASVNYDLNGLDFITIPFSKQRLFQSVERYKMVHSNLKRNSLSEIFIHIKSDGKDVRLCLEDIFYIKGLKEYLKIYLSDGKSFVVHASFDQMMFMLNNPQFIRCQRSYIINVSKVIAKDSHYFYLPDETKVPIGSKYKENIPWH